MRNKMSNPLPTSAAATCYHLQKPEHTEKSPKVILESEYSGFLIVQHV